MILMFLSFRRCFSDPLLGGHKSRSSQNEKGVTRTYKFVGFLHKLAELMDRFPVGYRCKVVDIFTMKLNGPEFQLEVLPMIYTWLQ